MSTPSSKSNSSGQNSNAQSSRLKTSGFTKFEMSLTTLPVWSVLLGFAAVMILLEFYGPWWDFIAPCMALGFLIEDSRHEQRPAIKIDLQTIAGCTALIWTLMAFIRDADTHWRLSPRLAGLFHLPFAFGIYLILALVVFFLGGLSVRIGQTLRFFLRRTI